MYGAGSERLRALDGPWFLGDALGSVRTTLDDDGAVVATASYDPWGTPQGELVGPFGFTGELHHGEQVYLRARWYHPGSGTFTARDPFAGWAETPYSLHAYQYAYRAPTVWTDPSGEVIGDACTPPYAWHAEEKVCVLRSDVPPWLRFLPEKRDPTFAIPAPMLVGSAPGAVGQLGGRPLGHLGREGWEACINLIGGTLVWMLTQTHVDTQTQTNDKDNETFVGYHGTTSKHLATILAGINPPTGANYSGFSQLGEGFYTTPELAVAQVFADNAVAVKGGQPVVLKVYARNFERMIGLSVPKHLWWKQPFPTNLIIDYDYLVAPISSYEPAIQYKFNPRAYPSLRVSET